MNMPDHVFAAGDLSTQEGISLTVDGWQLLTSYVVKVDLRLWRRITDRSLVTKV